MSMAPKKRPGRRKNKKAGRSRKRSSPREPFLSPKSTRAHSSGNSGINGPVQTRSRRRGQVDTTVEKRQTRQTSSSARSENITDQRPPTQASDSRGSDIPGYHYDEETKLYFKIQSYNLGMVAPFITADKIASKQKENQRVQDIKNLSRKSAPASTACRSTNKPNNHIVSVLKDVQCGQFTCENLKTYMVRHMCSRLQEDIKWENSLPGQPSFNLGEIQNMEVSVSRDKIACVSSLKSSYSQIIQLMTVDKHRDPHQQKRTVLRVKPPFLAVGPIHKRIKTMCWAPMKERQGQPTVLYTTVCPIGCLASIAYISNLEAGTENERIMFELNLGKTIVWSSAWTSNGNRFTIGTERRCYLIDVATRKQWTYSTCDSDPLSQLFSSVSPHIYNGTRKGHILLHDVRAPDQGRYTVMMTQGPGVGCLRLLKNENYLMASDFSGMICTWDQRVCKKVIEFKGLVNSHWQLPFHVDETESLVTSTGSDSYTHLWDMRNGAILRSVPPPYPVSCDSFPMSLYSTQWTGRAGNNALLLAMKNSFSFYTYRDLPGSASVQDTV